MLRYTVRPIGDRRAFHGEHETSRFRSTWIVTLDDLEREIRAINGAHVVIEVDVDDRWIRNDGTLHANAKANSPAARVAFTSADHGPLQYATDRFLAPQYGDGSHMESWQHNVRAIAMTLEALRAVDRYGVAGRGEQYQGWKALPPGATALGTQSQMTLDEAARALANYAEDPDSWAEAIPDDDPDGGPVEPTQMARLLYRLAARRTHPDSYMGTRDAWDRVQEAARVLGIST